MIHSHQRNRPDGFTLIELLVVISIIAMLIAILLPALGKARTAAQMLQSESQMRQVQMGLLNYTIDYDGKLPYSATTQGVPKPVYWPALLGPAGGEYLPSVDVFWGPLRMKGYQTYDPNGLRNSLYAHGWIYSGYTANLAGVMPGDTDSLGRKPIRVHQGGLPPSQLMVLFEAYYIPNLVSLNLDGWYACNHTYLNNGVFTYDGNAITSYLDGHVETVASEELGWLANNTYEGQWDMSSSYDRTKAPWYFNVFTLP